MFAFVGQEIEYKLIGLETCSSTVVEYTLEGGINLPSFMF